MQAQDKPVWTFTLVAGVSTLIVGYAIWRSSAKSGWELPKRFRKSAPEDDAGPVEDDEPKGSTETTDLPAVPPPVPAPAPARRFGPVRVIAAGEPTPQAGLEEFDPVPVEHKPSPLHPAPVQVHKAPVSTSEPETSLRHSQEPAPTATEYAELGIEGAEQAERASQPQEPEAEPIEALALPPSEPDQVKEQEQVQVLDQANPSSASNSREHDSVFPHLSESEAEAAAPSASRSLPTDLGATAAEDTKPEKEVTSEKEVSPEKEVAPEKEGTPEKKGKGHARRKSTKILMSSPTLPATPFASATSGAVNEAPPSWPLPPRAGEAKVRSPTTSLGSQNSSHSLRKDTAKERREKKHDHTKEYQDGKHTYTYEPIAVAPAAPKSSPHKRNKSLTRASTKSMTQTPANTHATGPQSPVALTRSQPEATPTGMTVPTFEPVAPPDEHVGKTAQGPIDPQPSPQGLAVPSHSVPEAHETVAEVPQPVAEREQHVATPKAPAPLPMTSVAEPPVESTQATAKSEETEAPPEVPVIQEPPVEPDTLVAEAGPATAADSVAKVETAPTPADAVSNMDEPAVQATMLGPAYGSTVLSAAGVDDAKAARRQTPIAAARQDDAAPPSPSSIDTFSTAVDANARASLKPVAAADSASYRSPVASTRYATPELVPHSERLSAVPVPAAAVEARSVPSAQAEKVDSGKLPAVPTLNSTLPAPAEGHPGQVDSSAAVLRAPRTAEPARQAAATDGYTMRVAEASPGSKIPRARTPSTKRGDRMSMPPAARPEASASASLSKATGRHAQRMSMPPQAPLGGHEHEHENGHGHEHDHGSGASPSLARRSSSKFFSLHSGAAGDAGHDDTVAPRKRRQSLTKRASSLFHKKDKTSASIDPPPMPTDAVAAVQAAQLPSTAHTQSSDGSVLLGHHPRASRSSGSGSGSNLGAGSGRSGPGSGTGAGGSGESPRSHRSNGSGNQAPVQAPARAATKPQPPVDIAAGGDGEKHGLGARLRRLSFGKSLKKRHSYTPSGDAPPLPSARPGRSNSSSNKP